MSESVAIETRTLEAQQRASEDSLNSQDVRTKDSMGSWVHEPMGLMATCFSLFPALSRLLLPCVCSHQVRKCAALKAALEPKVCIACWQSKGQIVQNVTTNRWVCDHEFWGTGPLILGYGTTNSGIQDH